MTFEKASKFILPQVDLLRHPRFQSLFFLQITIQHPNNNFSLRKFLIENMLNANNCTYM